MVFSDLSSAKGLQELNAYLADKSYISGYQPTKQDVNTANAITKAPAASYPHALRWYNHIKSYTANEIKQFADGTAATAPSAAAKPAAAAPPAKKQEDDDDDVDLFGSDEEDDEEAVKIREERLKAYNEKKSKKPELIAKSSVVLDVKPWDDETDMKEMEKHVRSIEMDGLIWGASKLVPVGYGINKLQIMSVVEDAKVSIDLLTEKIEEFEDFVQSVDVAAFNKI